MELTRYKIFSVCAAGVCEALLLIGGVGAQPAPQGSIAVKDTPPDNSGPLQVVSASWLGGPSNADLVAAAIGRDGNIILAGNMGSRDFPGVKRDEFGPRGAVKESPSPDAAANGAPASTFGSIIRLSPDGQRVLSYTRFGEGMAALKGMKLDAQGNVYVLAQAPHNFTIAGAQNVSPDAPAAAGPADFIAKFSPNAKKLEQISWPAGEVNDFAVDSNGDLVTLSGTSMHRYAAGGLAAKWTATWSSHGSNRPGAMTLSPTTGVAAVVGYGMTGTGHEPYKDPYAYGFDRGGKRIWSLWNPDPKQEAGSQFGGNGLMADTTGHAAGVDADGNLFLMLFADGGNTVLSKDPANPFQPLKPDVMDGVFQPTAGYGFHGANKTSAIFRVNPVSGAVEKATFMSAWIGWPTRDRANGLSIDAVTGTTSVKTADGKATGLTFLAGDTAFGCPTMKPWFEAAPGFYKGGGFLAVCDRNFKMIQSGYFPGATIRAVAYRDGLVVIAGSAVKDNQKTDTDPTTGKKIVTVDPVRLYHPLQNVFGGGDHQGYVVILKLSPTALQEYGQVNVGK